MARPLPLTLTPHPGESLPSHLGRLAHRYRLNSRDLGTHLGLTVKGHTWGTATWAIALGTETTQRLGEQLRLEPADVTGMTLQGLGRSHLRFSSEVVTAADPSTAARRYHGQTLRRLLNRVGLAYYTSSQCCQSCLAERPGVWLLEWRLPWVLACPTHHILLVTDPKLLPSKNPNGHQVDGRSLVPVQRVLQSRSRGPSGRVFIADVAATAETLLAYECFDDLLELNLQRAEAVALWRASSRPQFDVLKLPPAAALSAALPVAVRAAGDAASGRLGGLHERVLKNQAATTQLRRALRRLHDDGAVSPTLQLVGRDSSPSRRRRRLSPTISRQAGPWERFPQILPMRLFAGDLSDLLYPLPALDGQRLAAIGAAIHNGAPTPREAGDLLDLGVHGHRGWWALIGRLQEQGREERFWEAIERAAELLTTERVDYPHRRDLAVGVDLQRQVHRQVRGEVDFAVSNQWLLEYWAAAYPFVPVAGPRRWRNPRLPLVDELDRVDGERLSHFLAPADRRIGARA